MPTPFRPCVRPLEYNVVALVEQAGAKNGDVLSISSVVWEVQDVIPIALAVAAAIASGAPDPPLLKKTWYEIAEAELTCTALADESERLSLNAPFVSNSRDPSTFAEYFKGAPQSERHDEFRYLGALAAIGWWANRLNDQALLIDIYLTIGVTADRYLKSHPNDLSFKQISRCARTHVIEAELEQGRFDLADQMATSLARWYTSSGHSLPVEDWPLLLALRETSLQPGAGEGIRGLVKVAIDLAGAAMRANQNDRAGRFLAAAARETEAMGDTTLAWELILRSLTVAGKPTPPEVQWRSMVMLYDAQVRRTGEKDAAKIAAMLTPPTPPPALTDPHTVFECYLRLAMAAKTQERWDDWGKFALAARAAAIGVGGNESPSLLFLRHAFGELAGHPDTIIAVLTRLKPGWGQRNLATYIAQGERLLGHRQGFVGDAASHLNLEDQIDDLLDALGQFREAIPGERGRIDDMTFRLAQLRSFGRLTVAVASAEATRLQLSSALRWDVERFLSMATRNGFYIRGFFNRVRRPPGEPPPNGASLWPVMLTLDVYQNETTGKFSDYVAYLERTVPTIMELATAHPLPLREFQRRLLPGEALVATEVSPFALYVWAITSSGVQVTRQRVTEAELTNTVTRLRASLKPSSGSGSSSLPAFDAASAYKLYNLVFAPIADQFKDVRTLIWYGHGPLAAVPPAVLVTAPPATPSATTLAQFGALSFLVDRFAIAVLPDLSMFPQMRAKTPGLLRAGKFLGIGAPLLSADEIDGARRSQSDELARGFTGKSLADLPKLPEAADEMKALAALFPVGQSTLWLGPAADEHGVVSDRLLSFGTIAFATHGFLADEIENVREPSLMLALMPDAHDRFDGILGASEIALLRLNADLVILSACNTASSDGRPHGDAFTGLTQAFFTAGARNVMVSQWPVMSGAAVQLSVGTVERALNGKETLARSLQLAMQALRKAAVNALEAHPAYWGPFVIAGDGR